MLVLSRNAWIIAARVACLRHAVLAIALFLSAMSLTGRCLAVETTPASEDGVIGSQTLQSIEEVLALSKEEITKKPKFEIEATVYHFDEHWEIGFLEQDGHFFSCDKIRTKLSPGTVVRARGIVRSGALKNTADMVFVEPIGEKELAAPTPIRLSDTQLGERDCEWISIEAKVMAIRIADGRTFFRCRQGDRPFGLTFPGEITPEEALAYLDSTVGVDGCLACETGVDGKASGYLVMCSRDHVQIIEPSSEPVELEPIRKVADLWNDPDEINYHVRGHITWIGSAGIAVETEESGTWLHNNVGLKLQYGSKIEAFGRRDPETAMLKLGVVVVDNEWDDLAPVEEIGIEQLYVSRPESRRIKIRGEIDSTGWHNKEIFEFTLANRGRTFQAWLKADADTIYSMDLRTAKSLALTGVVTFKTDDENVDFRMFVSWPEDVTVIERKAIWTTQSVAIIAGTGVALLGLCLLWGSRLKSKVTEGNRNLKKVAAELNHAYESVREGILILGTNGKVKYANQRASEILGTEIAIGMSAEAVLGNLTSKVAQDDFAEEWRNLNASRTDAKELELSLSTEGSYRLVEVFTSPVKDNDEKFINRLWTFRDVTEKEELHQSLVHLQKQEAIGRLASGFAHDFNNLLMGIVGNLGVAAADRNSKVEDVHDSLETAIDAAERAASLVSQILIFSRKSRLEMKSCDINAILDRMDKLMRPALGNGIDIEFQLANDLPSVDGDANQLEQVFLNMCLNARDAIRNTGRITIRTLLKSNVVRDVDGDQTGRDYCVVVIRDNGSGIPAEVQNRVFEPFFTTKVESGTGLGLAMSDGIVDQHGGWIEFDSTVNVGTEFRIFLPTAEAPKSSLAVTPTPRPSISLHGTSGLVVDDEEIVRKALAAILTHEGVEVTTANNGLQAMRLLNQSRVDRPNSARCPFDFILLDWSMPVMDGKDALKQIKALYPEVPTIICSGYTFDCEEVTRQIGAKPDAVLQKPHRPDRIAELIRSVISGAKKQDRAAS